MGRKTGPFKFAVEKPEVENIEEINISVFMEQFT